MRERIDLNGIWSFTFDAEGLQSERSLKPDREIEVPFCYQSQFPDHLDYTGVCWYRRRVGIPSSWRDNAVILHFDAVNYFAQVWVNDAFVGEHEGGYTPFEFDIRNHVRFGDGDEITVRVILPGGDHPEFPFREIPHGKQDWYARAGGIWQDVYLECRHTLYIDRLKISPDVDGERARVSWRLNQPSTEGLNIILELLDPQGKLVVDHHPSIGIGERGGESELRVSGPHLWSPDTPELYTLRASLMEGSRNVDVVEESFGMRKIHVAGGRVYLNNRPIYIVGALDQDFYPRTIYTPPSDDYIRDQFRKAKELGLNLLRCHLKVPHPRYLHWADRMGLLIWYEIPNWGNSALPEGRRESTEGARKRGEWTLREMIDRDWNHPSVVIRGIVNEDWGTDLAGEAEHRRWLGRMYRIAKELDPARLVVDNSACQGNFHIRTDLEDFHMYRAIPDHAEDYRRWIGDFAKHPDWTFSPYGDGERTGEEALVLSEFGNWGLPSLEKLRKCYGGEPWWFKTQRHADNPQDATRPEGVEGRFALFGLDSVFGNFERFSEFAQWQEFRALKYEIEQMRKYPSIVGYVITEFTDIHWESNGLLDMCRNPKAFYWESGIINAQDAIVPDAERYNFWSGERCRMRVYLSHFSARRIAGCRLAWELQNLRLSGEIPGISAKEGEVVDLGFVDFGVPEVPVGVRSRLKLRLLNEENAVLCWNYVDLRFFPESYKRVEVGHVLPIQGGGLKVYLAGAADRYGGRLEGMGLSVASSPEEADRVIALDEIPPSVEEHLRRGGRVFYFATEPHPRIVSDLPLSVEARSGERSGDWCSNFNWARKDGAFRRVPGGSAMGFECAKIIPDLVLTPIEAFESVQSGMVVGWVRSPGVYLGEIKCGEGRLVASTLSLLDNLGDDPVATVVFRDSMGI
ncbi:MAG: glycoside hydrolase family 2 protein [bacterium]